MKEYLDKSERSSNLRDAFKVNERKMVKGAKILLVDLVLVHE